MKKAFYILIPLGLFFLVLKLYVNKEIEDFKEIKSHPIMYTFRIDASGKATSSVIAETKECMVEIEKYNSIVDKKDRTPYLPICFSKSGHSIRYETPVYLLSLEPDSIYAKIAVFYKTRSGERYYTAFIFKNELHREPYKR